MVFGRDCSGEAGSGAAGEGGIGDDGRGKGWKDKREGSLEVTAPSSVGEGRCNGHRDTLPSEWMAYLLAPKLGNNITLQENQYKGTLRAKTKCAVLQHIPQRRLVGHPGT